MKVESYLMFEGRCEEALDFYCSALGAKVTTLMRFKETPSPPGRPVAAKAAARAPRPTWSCTPNSPWARRQ